MDEPHLGIRAMTGGDAGFRPIGVRERVGRHHGVRRDVVLIERRSPVVN